MWQKATQIFLSFAMFSCSPNSTAVIECESQNRIDSIGGFIYQVCDTTSSLYIHHEECTECLDAYVDSGTVYLPDTVFRQMKLRYDNRGSSFVPSVSDLHLLGKGDVTAELFGDSLNYGELQSKKYLVTGKVIGIKGLGIVFRVDTYQEIMN